VLGNFTDEGAQDIKSLRRFVEDNMRQGEQLGLKVHGWYLTMRRYDLVVIIEEPDDETMAAQVLGVAGRCRSRTETLRAFSLDEVDSVFQKLG
jgi:uncharacterized protein with GYD domain